MSAEYILEVVDVIPRIEGVKSFRLEKPDNFSFKPGQWLFVYLDVDGEEQRKPLSFSSSPAENGYIEFTKRLTSSAFSKKLDIVERGERIKVIMPQGNFTFEGELQKIALLSGGIGITPFKSICENALDSKIGTDIVLLYGNNSPDSIIFKEEFDHISSLLETFSVVYTVSEIGPQSASWDGCLGRIDADMIRYAIPDFSERTFFVCGPPAMVECLISILKNQLKLPDDMVRRENFIGY